jgi:hypothetical protein
MRPISTEKSRGLAGFSGVFWAVNAALVFVALLAAVEIGVFGGAAQGQGSEGEFDDDSIRFLAPGPSC